jgi:D-xylose 1-dehydrogenase (NADP+, D-xylono-1,5-lactone-forming)
MMEEPSRSVPTPLRWGIVSTAAIAADVIPGLQRSSRNELVAVASRTDAAARSFADANGIPHAYGGYDAMLDSPEIDCVYIPLPNHLHGQWTERAVLAGKHVLCEKPFVVDPAEANRLFTLADVRGVHLAEAFMYRHHPKTRALKDVVTSGRLGAIHTVRSWFTYPAEDAENDVRFQPGMDGGALRDVGSYPVSMSNYLLDAEPEHVTAVRIDDANGIDERFYGSMRYANGAVAQFDCSMRSQSGYGVTVVGERGSAALSCPWYSHLEPHHVDVVTADGAERVVPECADNPYFLETENFADVVSSGADPEVTASETVRTMRTLARLHSAART